MLTILWGYVLLLWLDYYITVVSSLRQVFECIESIVFMYRIQVRFFTFLYYTWHVWQCSSLSQFHWYSLLCVSINLSDPHTIYNFSSERCHCWGSVPSINSTYISLLFSYIVRNLLCYLPQNTVYQCQNCNILFDRIMNTVTFLM